MPPTVAVVDCGWTGMEAGESCSQWLALAVVEGGSSSDADAAGSRRGSGGEGEGGGGTGFIKREEGGLHAGVETEEGTGGDWDNHNSISLCLLVPFWTSTISRGCVVLVGTETELHF